MKVILKYHFVDCKLHFANNLWDKAYPGDAEAKTGDPLFVDPKAHSPKGYKLQSGSAARGQGMLLYENQVDFWGGARPHLSKTEKYDCTLGMTFGARGGRPAAGSLQMTSLDVATIRPPQTAVTR